MATEIDDRQHKTAFLIGKNNRIIAGELRKRRRRMRIAIVAESFLPNINGVTNSILRVLEYCHRHGHDALVIAPGAREVQDECPDYAGFPIARVPTVQVPLIDSLPIGVPTPTVKRALRKYKPDVVHAASPFVLGAAGAFGSAQLGIPTVAIYQTDVAGFANNYHMKPLASAAWQWTRTVHNACSRTLAPSSVTIQELRHHKIRDVYHWARGVDIELFSPVRARCRGCVWFSSAGDSDGRHLPDGRGRVRE